MNCKPGDIAIAVCCDPKYVGHMFEVLYQAPPNELILPDGTAHQAPRTTPSWVVKSLAGGCLCAFENGSVRVVRYGVAADKFLRPIRGIQDDVDVEQRSEEPA